MPIPPGLVGAAKGFERAAQNIYKIQQAREKTKKDNELFDMNMKIKKLELQKAERTESPEYLELGRKKLELENKTHKLELDKKELVFNEADREARIQKEGYGDRIKGGIDIMREIQESGVPGLTATLDVGEKLKISTKKEKAETAGERKITGQIRALKDKNAPLEDIQNLISYQGYTSEDFAEELEGYAPEPKLHWWEKGKQERGRAD